MPSWSRADALLAITSLLGVDALIPTRLTAHEEISQPFSFEVEAVSQIGAVEPDTLLNQALCVILQASGKPVRYFHGVVQGLRSLGKTRGETAAEFFAYRLTLAPRLWFLNQTTDCRIFQKKSTSDILKKMFQEAGMSDFELRVTGSLSPREYTIQSTRAI